MTIFDKFAALRKTLAELEAIGADPFGTVIEEVLSATEGTIHGRRAILAGTNNYLGLSYDPRCTEAAAQAARNSGTGTTGSRMANGSFASHLALEKELADYYGWPHAIVFSTGYLANLGVLSAVTGPKDVLLIDSDCHASIYDGCRLSGAEIIRFRHNNPQDLEKRLRRLGERASNTLIVVEGIYSMLGDRAPLAEIAAIKARHGAYLLVDEAHSLGVLGETGRGLCEADGVQDQVDFVVGTFSKSLGATGGFCVSPLAELELVRYSSRPYIFTASPSPSVIASTRRALQILASEPDLRDRLWRNARHLYTALQELGFQVGPELSPVIAVVMPEREQALQAWHTLLDQGIYVNMMLPPATPNNLSLLRCSVSAAHSEAQIEQICRGFAAVRAELDAAGVRRAAAL